MNFENGKIDFKSSSMDNYTIEVSIYKTINFKKLIRFLNVGILISRFPIYVPLSLE